MDRFSSFLYRVAWLGEPTSSFVAARPELERSFAFRSIQTADLASLDRLEADALLVFLRDDAGLLASLAERSPGAPNMVAIVTEQVPAVALRKAAFDEVIFGEFSANELEYHLGTAIKTKRLPLEGTAEKKAADQADHAWHGSQEHLRLMVENATDYAMVTLDATGRLTYWSAGAEKIFGYTAQEVVGRLFDFLFTPEDIAARVPAGELTEALENGHAEDRRWQRRKSGELFWANGTVVTMRTGDTRGFLKILRDETDRKRVEDKLEAMAAEQTINLRRVNEQLENYSTAVAHDLRAPLATIRGFCDVLHEDYAAELKEGADIVRRIARCARRMDELVASLLEYSRTAMEEVRLEPLDLETVVNDSVEKHRLLLKTKAASIEIGPQLPVVCGTYFLVSQIIDNLLANAVKFSRKDCRPEVRIYAEREGNWIRLWVEDNGIGIDERHHRRIFEPLRRLNPDHLFKGHGLGLAIVQRAVERMNGRVGVESVTGHGSRFWVELPAAPVGIPVSEDV